MPPLLPLAAVCCNQWSAAASTTLSTHKARLSWRQHKKGGQTPSICHRPAGTMELGFHRHQLEIFPVLRIHPVKCPFDKWNISPPVYSGWLKIQKVPNLQCFLMSGKLIVTFFYILAMADYESFVQLHVVQTCQSCVMLSIASENAIHLPIKASKHPKTKCLDI